MLIFFSPSRSLWPSIVVVVYKTFNLMESFRLFFCKENRAAMLHVVRAVAEGESALC